MQLIIYWVHKIVIGSSLITQKIEVHREIKVKFSYIWNFSNNWIILNFLIWDAWNWFPINRVPWVHKNVARLSLISQNRSAQRDIGEVIHGCEIVFISNWVKSVPLWIHAADSPCHCVGLSLLQFGHADYWDVGGWTIPLRCRKLHWGWWVRRCVFLGNLALG